MDSEYVAIGKVLKPHGIRGELKVYPLTTVPGRFLDIGSVVVEFQDGSIERRRIRQARYAGELVVVRLDDVDTRNDAERFSGAFLSVPRAETAKLQEGQYYTFDLIGVQVENEKGVHRGEIIEIESYPANDVLVIRGIDDEIVQVPAVREFVLSVDMERKKAVIRFPGYDAD